MKDKLAIAALVAIFAGIVHYLPEPALSAAEIRFHQAVRDFVYGVGEPDRLFVTRGQIRFVEPAPIDSPPQRAQVGVMVDWGSLAAMLGVFTGLYALLTKMIIAPMIHKAMAAWMEAADKKYVGNELFIARREHLDAVIGLHVKTDEAVQASIDKRLDQLFELASSK